MPSDKMLHIQGELSKSREAITTCSSPTAAGSSKRQHDNTRNEYNTDSKQQSIARRARIIAIAVPNPFCCLLQPRAPLSTLASGTSEGTARGSLLTWGFRLSHTVPTICDTPSSGRPNTRMRPNCIRAKMNPRAPQPLPLPRTEYD